MELLGQCLPPLPNCTGLVIGPVKSGDTRTASIHIEYKLEQSNAAIVSDIFAVVINISKTQVQLKEMEEEDGTCEPFQFLYNHCTFC